MEEGGQGKSVHDIKNMLMLQRRNTYTPYLSTKAKAHWFYREGGKYFPYDDETSMNIEQMFQEKKGIGVAVKDLFEFHFDNMTSIKKGASKPKSILRAVWFFRDKEGTWFPYEMDTAGDLEAAVQNVETGKAKISDFKVKVSDNPPRFVIPVGESVENFKQIRETKNANPKGRQVLRGYNGTIYKKVTPF